MTEIKSVPLKMTDPMDDAMRRANPYIGRAQCKARDALLIEMAVAIGNVAEPGRRNGIHFALKKFTDALSIPVPQFLPPTEPGAAP